MKRKRSQNDTPVDSSANCNPELPVIPDIEDIVPPEETPAEQQEERRIRRRRRRSKPEPETYDTPILIISSTCKAAFTVVSIVRKCPLWKLDDDEANELAEQIKPAWDEYVAPNVGKYVSVASALISIAGVAARKLEAEKEWKEKTGSSPSLGEKEPENQPI